MAWRYHGKAEVDVNQPRPFGVCDRCGFLFNLEDLRWQYQYAGTQLINLRLLVCQHCLDDPAKFLITPILPIDPPPVFNPRPEPYALDEVDYLSTQQDEPIITQDGDEIVADQASQNFSDPPGD